VEANIKLTHARKTFKPFAYPWAFDLWERHESMHWLPKEVPLHDDVKDWNDKLTDADRSFLTNVFRFFVQGDVDVADGYVTNYLPYLPQPEVRMMLLSFAAREAVHVVAYSHLIETLGMPDTIYDEFIKYREMADKHEYFEEINALDKNSIVQQIAAISAFTEGVQLFSSFAMLLNYPRHGKMKGMGQIITWSILDETAHCEGMIRIFRTFVEENRAIWNDSLKKQIYDIARKMVELEDAFIDLCFSNNEFEGLTASDLKQYIRYIADRRLIQMSLRGAFGVKDNPLPWIDEMINAPIYGNFFENKVTDYAKGAAKGSWGDVWA
jgi:ribonucleoside-diphosphate reductase beta chain